MPAKRWLVGTIATTVLSLVLIVGVNVELDLYGLYHDTHGRRLDAYGDPRVAKYLLSTAYVPNNFNAVLLGSSVSVNWNLTAVRGLRIYNESIDGGNIVEQKALLERVLAKPGIQTVFLIVHPYHTDSHDFKTLPLTPQLHFSALGSLGLLQAYKDALKVRLRGAHPWVDDVGTQAFVPRDVLNPTLTRLLAPGDHFAIDPVAFRAFQDLVELLHSHRVQVVSIVPPIAEELLARKRIAFGAYTKLIRGSLNGDDALIDFTSDAYREFRGTRANFGDGVHMFQPAADWIVQEIDAIVTRWIADGRLRTGSSRAFASRAMTVAP